jgi:hypothetical protein
MSRDHIPHDDRRRAARMVYRPDRFLAVMTFAATATLGMAMAFIVYMLR